MGVLGREDWLSAAVLNSTGWVDAVCSAHGRPGRLVDSVWVNPARSPSLYPNVQTTSARAGEREVSGAISLLDDEVKRSGYFVKDSFGALRLSSGFEQFLTATWIGRDSSAIQPRAQADWSPVSDAESLHAWERMWAKDNPISQLFPPSLVSEPGVSFHSARFGGSFIGFSAFDGCGVIGISNVFGDEVGPPNLWAAIVSEAERAFPGRAIVGYETGAELDAARSVGFRSLGTLAIWKSPGADRSPVEAV
jgi:hypothetical protein